MGGISLEQVNKQQRPPPPQPLLPSTTSGFRNYYKVHQNLRNRSVEIITLNTSTISIPPQSRHLGRHQRTILQRAAALVVLLLSEVKNLQKAEVEIQKKEKKNIATSRCHRNITVLMLRDKLTFTLTSF